MTIKFQIPDRLYFRIGDVAELLGIKPYVLRYWESEFPLISPQKSSSGQRVYRRSDVETVLMIKHLLYEERYSIEGAKKRIKELRKEGELKQFKDGAVAAASVEEASLDVDPNDAMSSDQEAISSESEAELEPRGNASSLDQARLQELANELRSLCETPISEIFTL